jgi:hypothetical protein
MSIDCSGPYEQTMSGNLYIIRFIDLCSGYHECFPTADKSTDTIIHLLLEEI